MHIRQASTEDAHALASVLNAIIAEGGKTAIDTPLTDSEFAEWFITGPHCISCVLATNDAGEPLGYQALERFHDDLPPGLADIGTFVTATSRGTGVGRQLSEVTFATPEKAGLHTIRAVIQRSNQDAIKYYRSIGFAGDGGGAADRPVTLLRSVTPAAAASV